VRFCNTKNIVFIKISLNISQESTMQTLEPFDLSVLPEQAQTELYDFYLFLKQRYAEKQGILLQLQTSKKQDALWDIIGCAEGEEADIARHHDKYLYGAK
jgi:hypothetical protein